MSQLPAATFNHHPPNCFWQLANPSLAAPSDRLHAFSFSPPASMAFAPRKKVLSGGCQCGALRFCFYSAPVDPHIRHCRMCQKALGAPFGAFCFIPCADVQWTRGEPSIFRSSEAAERGFCSQCGTPLFFRYLRELRIGFLICSFDEPLALTPLRQCAMESAISWAANIGSIPATCTLVSDPIMAEMCMSMQHPDHDTEEWP